MMTVAPAVEMPPIRKLREFIQSCSGDMLGRTQIRGEKNRLHEFRLMIGPCLQVMKYAQAFLLLTDSGFTREAEPLARAALEHAVTMQWSYLTKDGIDRMIVWGTRTEKEHWEQVGAWSHNDEISTFARGLSVPNGPSMANYGTFLKEMVDGEFFQLSQAVLSQTVHITSSSISSHFDNSDASKLIQFPTAYFLHGARFVVAVACMLAAGVIADVTYDGALEFALDEASERLPMPRNLQPHIPEKRARDLPEWPTECSSSTN